MSLLGRMYIQNIFSKHSEGIKRKGIWLSGIASFGEYKEWWNDDNLYLHAYFSERGDGVLDGEYKEWYSDGKPSAHAFYSRGRLEGEFKKWHTSMHANKSLPLVKHKFYKHDNEVEMPNNIKDNYILVDGKYYKD